MTTDEAIQLISWINKEKLKEEDKHFLKCIEHNLTVNRFKPDAREARELTRIYSYTSGGGQYQGQPFKQYRRKTSWGVK